MTRSSDLVARMLADGVVPALEGRLASGAGVAIHNRSSHRRCVRGNHILPAGSHGSGHCIGCDHLVTDQVAIPWDQPACPTSCWDAFTADDHNNPFVEDW